MDILARAVGRRKEAVAQIKLIRGNGKFLINDKPAEVYLQNNSCSLICIKSPLEAALSLSSNNFSNIHRFPDQDSALIQAVNGKLEEQSTILRMQTEKSEILTNKEGGLEANVASSSVNTNDSPPSFPNSAPVPSSLGKEPITFGTKQSEKQGAEGMELLSVQANAPSEARSMNEGRSFELNVSGDETQNLNDSTHKLNLLPLNNLVSLDEIDVLIKVKGGGLIGQAEAIKLGIARAVCLLQAAFNEGIFKKILKTKGYLTQDSRVKERRKYGLKKARKASQYHKR
uniref:Small ribosomal subunit protein uS9c n=1 Tax=Chlamydomonas nivalis TaxID=47906 RepID=A0A0S2IBF5_9CHLO|nr:ribosomal protein S9 [Chlamydomonas nivalis]